MTDVPIKDADVIRRVNIVDSDPNQPSLAHGQHILAATNTAEAISSGQAVPNGMAVLVKALESNAGNVYVGGSQVTVNNGDELQPGQATALAVTDVATIHIAADNLDGVSWIVEVS